MLRYLGLNGRYKLLNKYATVASVSVRRGSTGKAAHHADVAVIFLSGDARPRSTDLGPLPKRYMLSLPKKLHYLTEQAHDKIHVDIETNSPPFSVRTAARVLANALAHLICLCGSACAFDSEGLSVHSSRAIYVTKFQGRQSNSRLHFSVAGVSLKGRGDKRRDLKDRRFVSPKSLRPRYN